MFRRKETQIGYGTHSSAAKSDRIHALIAGITAGKTADELLGLNITPIYEKLNGPVLTHQNMTEGVIIGEKLLVKTAGNRSGQVILGFAEMIEGRIARSLGQEPLNISTPYEVVTPIGPGFAIRAFRAGIGKQRLLFVIQSSDVIRPFVQAQK